MNYCNGSESCLVHLRLWIYFVQWPPVFSPYFASNCLLKGKLMPSNIYSKSAATLLIVSVMFLIAVGSSSNSSRSSSSAQEYDEIYLQNQCNDNIQAAISYKNLNGEWETKGWYSLAPNAKAFVAKTKNRIYYTYAESITSGLKWSGDAVKESIRNEGSYGFRKKEIRSDTWTTWIDNFTCENNVVGTSKTKSAVVSNANNRSDAYVLYKACHDGLMRGGYDTKPEYKAAYAGIIFENEKRKTWNCYWVWGRSSQENANQDALESCKKTKTKCYAYIAGSNLSGWAIEQANQPNDKHASSAESTQHGEVASIIGRGSNIHEKGLSIVIDGQPIELVTLDDYDNAQNRIEALCEAEAKAFSSASDEWKRLNEQQRDESTWVCVGHSFANGACNEWGPSANSKQRIKRATNREYETRVRFNECDKNARSLETHLRKIKRENYDKIKQATSDKKQARGNSSNGANAERSTGHAATQQYACAICGSWAAHGGEVVLRINSDLSGNLTQSKGGYECATSIEKIELDESSSSTEGTATWILGDTICNGVNQGRGRTSKSSFRFLVTNTTLSINGVKYTKY